MAAIGGPPWHGHAEHRWAREGGVCPRCQTGRMLETQGMADSDPVYLECSVCGYIDGDTE